jgi:hypothetical protein
VDFPSFIEQSDLDRSAACQMNLVGSKAKVLCGDAHQLSLTIATDDAETEEKHGKGAETGFHGNRKIK